MKEFIKKIVLFAVFMGVLVGFALVAYVIQNAQDPTAQLEKLLVNDDNTIAKAFFTPDDDVKSMLVKLIDVEQKRILIAIYTVTDKEIAQALIAAHERGIVVELVVDRGYGADRYSKIPVLANHKIPIWVYQCAQDERNASLMHNKFCIFEQNILGKALLWTGSYNFTVRASTRNQENVLVLDNKNLVQQFIKQFDILKTRSLLISGKPGLLYTAPEQKPRYESFWQCVLKSIGIA